MIMLLEKKEKEKKKPHDNVIVKSQKFALFEGKYPKGKIEFYFLYFIVS
jgi:hypothetical protein